MQVLTVTKVPEAVLQASRQRVATWLLADEGTGDRIQDVLRIWLEPDGHGESTY